MTKEQEKLIDLTFDFEQKHRCKDYCQVTNVGYQINDIEYIFGEYIIRRGIAKDIDGDDIMPSVLYVYNGNDEYYKIGEEDLK